MELYCEILENALAVHEECPGVQYLCIEPRGDEATEYYIVEIDSPVISDEAKRYGVPFGDSAGRLMYVLDDVDSGKAIIEIKRYITANQLSMPDGESLSDCAEYAAELPPEYFGEMIPPHSTPRGKSLRCRALMNGVYLHETDKCEMLASICPPLCDGDLSDYTRALGIAEQDCLLFTERDACLALFELAQSYPDLKTSSIIDWPALATTIWYNHAEYAIAHNLREQSGFNDPTANLLRALGAECEGGISEERLISVSPETSAQYIFFSKVNAKG